LLSIRPYVVQGGGLCALHGHTRPPMLVNCPIRGPHDPPRRRDDRLEGPMSSSVPIGHKHPCRRWRHGCLYNAFFSRGWALRVVVRGGPPNPLCVWGGGGFGFFWGFPPLHPSRRLFQSKRTTPCAQGPRRPNRGIAPGGRGGPPPAVCFFLFLIVDCVVHIEGFLPLGVVLKEDRGLLVRLATSPTRSDSLFLFYFAFLFFVVCLPWTECNTGFFDCRLLYNFI